MASESGISESGASDSGASGAGDCPAPRDPARNRRRRHTLLITVDRLSGTARRLGVFRRANEVVQVSGGLFLLALDRLALLEATWAQFGAILSGATARSAIKLPGVDVVAGSIRAN